MALPSGQWAGAFVLLFAGVLVCSGVWERYLLLWLGGWLFLAFSRLNAAWPGAGIQATLALDHGCFILALTLFAVSVLYYTDSKRFMVWAGLLGSLGLGVAIIQALWFPLSLPAILLFQLLYRGIAVLAVARLVLYAWGRREMGPWIFALSLLLLVPDAHFAGSLAREYEFSSEALLRGSILLIVLEESRARAKQLGMAVENLRMMERISNSRRQWLATVDSIDDCILVHDDQPSVLRLNRALAQRIGRPLPELTGQPLAQVLPNAERGCPYCERAENDTAEAEDPCFGGYSAVSTSSFIEDQTGGTGTVHIIRDRTERRASEERYRLLFESVQEAVFVTTPDGKLIDHNPAFASILGYRGRAELVGIDVGRDLFLSAEQRAAYSEEMEKHGYLRNYEVALRRKDGRIVTLLENSFASRDADGKIVQYQGFLLDITEKKRIEEDMRRRNRELVALNAMASIAARTFDLDEILQNTLRWTTELFAQHCDILLFDLDSGHVTRSETNRENRDEERKGLRSMVEQELSEYIADVHAELVTERYLHGMPQAAQKWLAERGYESFVAVKMHSQRKTMGILLITSPNKNQFTETDQNLAIAIARQLGNAIEKVLLYEETARAYDNLRNTQEQLLQSEKMSAVGQLISGVAHELNNPLTAILGYAQLLETEPIGVRAQDYVRKLYLQTQRTHRVVQNLLSFSRQRKPIQSQVDLRRVMEDTLALREFDLKLNNVQTERSYDPAVPFITGDAHQLEQVFLNIINNAVDAIMDSGQGGSLKVRIYPEEQRACVEFRDSGPGLKDPSKIFDPFYTTKKLGKGTGLGLSICYGIVKEHGGDIIAFNHKEGGAVFQLKLPIAGAQKRADDAVARKSGSS